MCTSICFFQVNSSIPKNLISSVSGSVLDLSISSHLDSVSHLATGYFEFHI